MDFIGAIATQGGAGWLLFAGSLPVIFFLGRGWLAEKDKRAEDIKQFYRDKMTDEKDWLSLLSSYKVSIDTAIGIFNKIKQL